MVVVVWSENLREGAQELVKPGAEVAAEGLWGRWWPVYLCRPQVFLLGWSPKSGPAVTTICAHTGSLCKRALPALLAEFPQGKFPNVPGLVLGSRGGGGGVSQALPPALPSATPPSSQPSLTCSPRRKKVLMPAFSEQR